MFTRLKCRVCGRPQWYHYQLQGHQEVSRELLVAVRVCTTEEGRDLPHRCLYLHVCHMQEERGYVFESDTDTEVIPKLLNYMYDTQVQASTPMRTYVHNVYTQTRMSHPVSRLVSTLLYALKAWNVAWDSRNETEYHTS